MFEEFGYSLLEFERLNSSSQQILYNLDEYPGAVRICSLLEIQCLADVSGNIGGGSFGHGPFWSEKISYCHGKKKENHGLAPLCESLSGQT